jgi:DNA-binding transcriptional LysR family regulator
MELRRLRYFVAVAEAGNLTRAAARLGLEQPPLSVQIHALEAALGAQLFTRLPRGMALTAAGEALLPEARAILHAASAAAALVADVAKGRRERITLGVTTSAIMHPRVRTILGTLTRLYPDMRLTLREGSAAELTELLGAGTMQAAFIRAVVARPAGIRFQELCSEEMVAVLPSAHRLARARPGVRLEDLAGERFVFVRRAGAPGMYAELVRAAATLGFEPLVVAEVERMLTSVNLERDDFSPNREGDSRIG